MKASIFTRKKLGGSANFDDMHRVWMAFRVNHARSCAVAAAFLLCHCAAGPDAELRHALSEAYPGGWRYSTLREDLHDEMREGDSPAWIQGDFDGDGKADFATQVVVFKPGHTFAVDSASVLLAFLKRKDGLERHVLNTGGGPHQGIFLSRIAAGVSVKDVEGGPSVTLTSDGVYQIFANEAALAYLHQRGRWIEIAVSD